MGRKNHATNFSLSGNVVETAAEFLEVFGYGDAIHAANMWIECTGSDPTAEHHIFWRNVKKEIERTGQSG
jgi:hypothetical protein